MLKHKKFLSLLLVLPLFSITSCQKVTEKYTVLKEGQEGYNLTCEFPASWSEVHKAPFNLEDEFVDLTRMKFIDPKTSKSELNELFEKKKEKIIEKFRTAFN